MVGKVHRMRKSRATRSEMAVTMQHLDKVCNFDIEPSTNITTAYEAGPNVFPHLPNLHIAHFD